MQRVSPISKSAKRSDKLHKSHATKTKSAITKRKVVAPKRKIATSTSFSTTTTPTNPVQQKQQQPQSIDLSTLPTLNAFKKSTPLRSLFSSSSPTTTTSQSQHMNSFQNRQEQPKFITSKLTTPLTFKRTKPVRGLFDPVVRAYNEQSYESPQSQAIIDLPPLGTTIPLKESNDEWELCYDGSLGRTLIYLKKMSITSLVLSLVSLPFIVTFPSESISQSGKWVLALSTVFLGVTSTIFTNIFCSAYVCKAFVNKRYPNIMECTTVGFTGRFESFRFDVTEGTTSNVERPLTSFKHLATDRHFFVAPQMVAHPVWGMILPHLFDVDGEEETQSTDAVDESASVIGDQAVAVDASAAPQQEVTPAETHATDTTTTTTPVTTSPTPAAAATTTTTIPTQKVVDDVVDKQTAKAEQQAAPEIAKAVPTPPPVAQQNVPEPTPKQ